MATDRWTCDHCGARFVVANLATTPNTEHLPGCPLRTETR